MRQSFKTKGLVPCVGLFPLGHFWWWWKRNSRRRIPNLLRGPLKDDDRVLSRKPPYILELQLLHVAEASQDDGPEAV
jgi:hypothetical protein